MWLQRLTQLPVLQPHAQLTSKLLAYAATNHRLHLLDCSRIYLDPTGKRISLQLMPGGLHPSRAGVRFSANVCAVRLQLSEGGGRDNAETSGNVAALQTSSKLMALSNCRRVFEGGEVHCTPDLPTAWSPQAASASHANQSASATATTASVRAAGAASTRCSAPAAAAS